MDNGDLISPITTPVPGYSSQTLFNVTGLTQGKIYRFTFAASNSFGPGDASSSVSI